MSEKLEQQELQSKLKKLEQQELQSKLKAYIEKGSEKGWIDAAKSIIALAEKKNIPLNFSNPEVVSACEKGLEFSSSPPAWADDYYYYSSPEEIKNFATKYNIPL